MQWSFYSTVAYTKVLTLVVNGASAGTVTTTCHGQGEPKPGGAGMDVTRRPGIGITRR